MENAKNIHKKSEVLDMAKSQFIKNKMNSYLNLAKEAAESEELTQIAG